MGLPKLRQKGKNTIAVGAMVKEFLNIKVFNVEVDYRFLGLFVLKSVVKLSMNRCEFFYN